MEGGKDGGGIMDVMLRIQVQSSASTELSSLSLHIGSEWSKTQKRSHLHVFKG